MNLIGKPIDIVEVRSATLNRQRAAYWQTGNAEYPMVHPRGKGGCAPFEKEFP